MADSSERPQNLRAKTMSNPANDFKRMSFSMNSKNVVGKN